MRVVGIIAEYDPFHSGHAYHLAEARRAAHADAVVVVMSGCFTQRGGAALLSPADRARMALLCGADAVFLLPACWSVRDAEHFALGGVSLLHRLGVDAISFGTETDNLPLLQQCASLLAAPGASLQEEIRSRLASGIPYPAAFADACEVFLPGAGALLSSPNSTLAVCYLRAMQLLGADMDVVPVRRAGSYHATSLSSGFSSATALRGAILRGDWAGAERFMPQAAYVALRDAAEEGHIHRPAALDQALILRLREMAKDDWRALPDLSEGLEERLRACALRHATREDLLSCAKTRRYPYARLSRLCTHALLGVTGDALKSTPLPPVAWLLGMKDSALPVFSRARENRLPIWGKAADIDRSAPWAHIELRAFDLWALGCGLPAGMAMTQRVVRVTPHDVT